MSHFDKMYYSVFHSSEYLLKQQDRLMRAVYNNHGECYTTTRVLNLGNYSFEGELKWSKHTKQAANAMALTLERYMRDADDKFALRQFRGMKGADGITTSYLEANIFNEETNLLGPIGEVEADGFLAYSFHINVFGGVETTFFLTSSEERLDVIIDEFPRGLYDRTLLCWKTIPGIFFGQTYMDMDKEGREGRKKFIMERIELIVTTVIRRLYSACETFWHCKPTFTYFTSWQKYGRPSRIWNRNLFYGQDFLQLQVEWMDFKEREESFKLLSHDKDRVEQEWRLLLSSIKPMNNRTETVRERLFESRVSARSSMEYGKYMAKVTAVRTDTLHYTRQMMYPVEELGRQHALPSSYNMTASEIRLNRSWFPYFMFIEGTQKQIQLLRPSPNLCQGHVSQDTMLMNIHPLHKSTWWIGGEVQELCTTEYDIRMQKLFDEMRLVHDNIFVKPVCIAMLEEWGGQELEVSWSGLVEQSQFKTAFHPEMSIFRGVVAQLNAMALKESIMFRLLAWEKWTNFGNYIKFAFKWYVYAKEMEKERKGGVHERMEKLPLEYYMVHRKQFMEEVTELDLKENTKSRLHFCPRSAEVSHFPTIVVSEGAKGLNTTMLKTAMKHPHRVKIRFTKELMESAEGKDMVMEEVD